MSVPFNHIQKKKNELLDHNCNVNVPNFEKKTALHLMVENKNFDCIIALLSRGADVNIQDSDGNTSLHLAAQSPENIHILHSLIIFDADLNMLNNNGESPRHLIGRTGDLKALYCLHAVGAKRCTEDTLNCNDCCHAYGVENGDAPPDAHKYTNQNVMNNMLDVACMDLTANKDHTGAPRKGRLLSLDGGGIRGLILIQMLLELENAIGRPINHCFDWITGTSTGGILALGLASGKTAKECLGLYFRYKDRMFPGNRPYPSKPLEEMLEEMLGSDTYLQDIQIPKLIIPCCLADRQPIELHLYRNYRSPEELLNNINLVEYTLLWHVARATSAAPTYFRPFNNLIDGGLIANNPTLDALTEIHQYNLALMATDRRDEQSPANIVVSLGTGLVPVKATMQLPESLPDLLKVLLEAPGILSILIDQATAADGRVVERARAWCASIGTPYFRFNPQLSEEVGLNEKCNYKLCRILWETKAYMHANIQKIKEVADLLKE
ncbi:Ankyrin repeat-containing protein [Oryctes borbonicus]|uniref:phospholipase A2 n=1 Tax=Oryctes borbonicus TaxID=1629725 RepID=A0A0T6B6E7_9SCAR|nr:Ankyrin repeat-containing protein [Oryctes borbonicus]